jgi:hypothetical protein
MGISNQAPEAIVAQFQAEWEQAPHRLNWLRELSLTEKVSIFFNELKKSILIPSRKTRFFPKYCFNQKTINVIKTPVLSYEIKSSIREELVTYLKELAYAGQVVYIMRSLGIKPSWLQGSHCPN